VAASPAISSPVISLPATAPTRIEAPAPKPTPVASTPPPQAQPPATQPAAAQSVAVAPPQQTGAPLSTSMTNAEPTRVVGAGKQDIRILTYIDALRVTGIRAAGGSDSKVLMNDRVYRVNDMVDYTLGIRLTRVAAEGLTFVDGNGTVYVKNF
jgi:hypothetical protein